jgi:hypothetical protein
MKKIKINNSLVKSQNTIKGLKKEQKEFDKIILRFIGKPKQNEQ